MFDKLQPADKDQRLLVEVWDYDRTSCNDFMGSFSFGVTELLKLAPLDSWFKLLSQEEGEFYHLPIDTGRRASGQPAVSPSSNSSVLDQFDKVIPLASEQAGACHDSAPGAGCSVSDFDFLRLIGKGSFGAVSVFEWARSFALSLFALLLSF